MAQKLRLTRIELKRQRDALMRLNRYLPTLKLKQQQLQAMLGQVDQHRRRVQAELASAEQVFRPYEAILADLAGVDVRKLGQPSEVVTRARNIAGVTVPEFVEAKFAPAAYSLFATPAWVDRAIADLRAISRQHARLEVLDREHELLSRELTRIIQRVNLFEKVKIPEAREAIRRIRIHLGDEQTAAVVRAKIAKGKLQEEESRPVLGPGESAPGRAMNFPPPRAIPRQVSVEGAA